MELANKQGGFSSAAPAQFVSFKMDDAVEKSSPQKRLFMPDRPKKYL
jgi:hypothetical protein